MQELSLRSATLEDQDFIYSLHKDAFGPCVEQTWDWDEGWQRAYFRDRFDPSVKKIIVYRGIDVGCVSVQDHVRHLFSAYLAILPAFQRKGIGTFLIAGLSKRLNNEAFPSRFKRLG